MGGDSTSMKNGSRNDGDADYLDSFLMKGEKRCWACLILAVPLVRTWSLLLTTMHVKGRDTQIWPTMSHDI